MRTTLTLDDDVAVLIEKVRARREATFKEVVNEALRLGLKALEAPDSKPEPYRTRPKSLGRCRLPNVDDVASVLAIAEGEGFR